MTKCMRADLQALAESIPPSTGWSHGSHELHVLDLLGLTPLPVIPTSHTTLSTKHPLWVMQVPCVGYRLKHPTDDVQAIM